MKCEKRPEGDRPCGGEGHGPHIGTGEEGLALKLDRCAHFLFHRHKDARGQGKILKILSVSGPMTQKQLQEKLEIQAGSMSEIAAKLEGKGLITRTRDEEDKRRILLEITEEGRADVDRFTRRRKQEREMFNVLTGEEQRQLGALLDRLLENWEADGRRPPRRKADGERRQKRED